jgi:Cu-Zn family superoxide dismutase
VGAQELIARADLSPNGDGTARGTVEFLEGETGSLTINVMMMGLPAGPHGFHVHSGTDCMMPGEHWSPMNAEHGAADAAAGARHRGDLGNITADASGMVQETLSEANLGDDRSYIGKVIVVHENQDDLTTQPDGDSGEPLACGVIETGEGAEISQAPGEDRGV